MYKKIVGPLKQSETITKRNSQKTFTALECEQVILWPLWLKQSSFSRYAFLSDLPDLEVDFFSLLLQVLIV